MAKKPTPDQVKKIRSGITKKIRFEVFKRDGFKCQYCGSSAPDVILHVDHINPVSKGGDNDMMNLITSCDSCNGGKSDKLLSDNSIMEKQRQQLQELNTKREQLEMMIKWRDGLKSLKTMLLILSLPKLTTALHHLLLMTMGENLSRDGFEYISLKKSSMRLRLPQTKNSPKK
ncbi:HNH endonuclease [Escherichia coli]|uniref:HNH endonuclease n=1 Tax=Escherichia coli TaxID=562 RepID=UPI001F154243